MNLLEMGNGNVTWSMLTTDSSVVLNVGCTGFPIYTLHSLYNFVLKIVGLLLSLLFMGTTSILTIHESFCSKKLTI